MNVGVFTPGAPWYAACLLWGAISRKTAMGADIKLAFDILAFTSVMVLIVLGLGVIASMMGIFNFAHGEFVLLGAYTVYLFRRAAGCRLWFGIVAAPVRGRRSSAWPWNASSSAASMPRRSSRCSAPTRSGWSSARPFAACSAATTSRSPSRSPACSLSAASTFSIWRTVIIVHHSLCMPASWLLLARTSIGLRIRGALENPMLARACGISTAGSMH